MKTSITALALALGLSVTTAGAMELPRPLADLPAAPAAAPGCGTGAGCAPCKRGCLAALKAWLCYRPSTSCCCHCCCSGYRPTPLHYYFRCYPCFECARPVCGAACGSCDHGGCGHGFDGQHPLGPSAGLGCPSCGPGGH